MALAAELIFRKHAPALLIILVIIIPISLFIPRQVNHPVS